jgi:putative oxidoreductase
MSIKGLLLGGARIDSAYANIGLLILRVYTGLVLASQHGIRKIPPPEKFIQGVGELGFPLPGFFAWSAGCAEFFGGILLAVGLLTRPAAFFILITMLTAVLGRHAADPFSIKELAVTYGFIAITFLLIGSGRYGVDRIFHHQGTYKS